MMKDTRPLSIQLLSSSGGRTTNNGLRSVSSLTFLRILQSQLLSKIYSILLLLGFHPDAARLYLLICTLPFPQPSSSCTHHHSPGTAAPLGVRGRAVGGLAAQSALCPSGLGLLGCRSPALSHGGPKPTSIFLVTVVPYVQGTLPTPHPPRQQKSRGNTIPFISSFNTNMQFLHSQSLKVRGLLFNPTLTPKHLGPTSTQVRYLLVELSPHLLPKKGIRVGTAGPEHAQCLCLTLPSPGLGTLTEREKNLS